MSDVSLLKGQDFRDKFFGGGKNPCNRTLKAWLGSGEVLGCIIGTAVYVDEVDFKARLARSGGNISDKRPDNGQNRHFSSDNPLNQGAG